MWSPIGGKRVDEILKVPALAMVNALFSWVEVGRECEFVIVMAPRCHLAWKRHDNVSEKSGPRVGNRDSTVPLQERLASAREKEGTRHWVSG